MSGFAIDIYPLFPLVVVQLQQVSLSEAEVHWSAFLESLVSRGLHGLTGITSDAHSGLKAALRAVFPSVPWQRCQFHFQQNAQAYVPKKSMKKGVAEDGSAG